MTVSCGAPAISSGTMYPPKHTVDLGIDGERQMTFEQGNEVQMEVLGMAPTCANKIPHLEPCVPHDPDTPTYLRCKWTGAAGEVEVPVNAYADWITTNGIKSDLVARVNCSIPPYNSIVAATGYDGTLAFADGASLTVSLTFVRNESIQWDVPYAGEPGANIVTVHGWKTPPTAPSPPTAPPPPMAPCKNLLCEYGEVIKNFNFYQYPVYEKTGRICWSAVSEGHSWSSNTFHSYCNSKGKTLYIAKIKHAMGETVVGGYTRNNWYSSGYSSDNYAHLFQVEPSIWKSKAGTGQQSGYNYAIYRSNGYGPTFGAGHDWHTSSNMKTGYSNLGHAYKCRVGNYGQNACRNDFSGSYSSWTITESEVWSQN